MREIGLMGGAFNPPHLRHLMIAQCALDQWGLEKVTFIPSGEPPHKKADLLDKQVRLELTRAAVLGNDRFEASSIEVDRPGVTWTIDTLDQLQKLYGPGVRLNFIIGEDNLQTIKDYDRRTEFLSKVRLLVCPRKTGDPKQLETWRQLLPEADMEIIDCPESEMSSTLVRKWVRNGWCIRYLVPAEVHRLIVDRGLYLSTPPAPASPPPPVQTDSSAGDGGATTGSEATGSPASPPAPPAPQAISPAGPSVSPP